MAMDTGEREAAEWDNFGGITDTEGKDAEEEGEDEYENGSDEFDYGEDDDFADFKHFSEKIDNEGGIKALDDVAFKNGDSKKDGNEVFDDDLNALAGEADLIDIDDLFAADNGENEDQMPANAKAKDQMVTAPLSSGFNFKNLLANKDQPCSEDDDEDSDYSGEFEDDTEMIIDNATSPQTNDQHHN